MEEDDYHSPSSSLAHPVITAFDVLLSAALTSHCSCFWPHVISQGLLSVTQSRSCSVQALTERYVTGRRHLVTLRRHDGRQGHEKLAFISRVALAFIAKASI